MAWEKHCDRISNPKLKHGEIYKVKLESGHIIEAEFWVYSGGEEVAFRLPESKGELSVAEIYFK